MAFKPGIVICSRLDSERVPNKVLRTINGIPIIRHLVHQLAPLKVPIVVAVPGDQAAAYDRALEPVAGAASVWGSGHAKDPLARMAEVQRHYGFTHVVRVTHDKIFVDTKILRNALTIAEHENEGIEYLYSSFLTPGTGFEVIKAECLVRAAAIYKNVEHITYAVRPVSKVSYDLETKTEAFNLLIDFPEDLKLMEVIFASLGNAATLDDVTLFLKKNPELVRINLPPVLTIYTCVFNGEKFIQRAMNSVIHQGCFKRDMEYIIVDDHSTDKTLELVAKFAIGKPNVRWYRNEENRGLASSSNLALARARGNYILRLDADDFFVDDSALVQIIEFAKETRAEIVYPDNYFGSVERIQKGFERHHAGGALFDKRALNFLRFKDGLRNHDSLDIFTRAQKKLKIGYFEKPIFFYTQRGDSMSRTNLKERAVIAERIKAGTL
jgi:spore coat polysaccharide biosynthesis protein SpsF (cytidylyltransferase family)